MSASGLFASTARLRVMGDMTIRFFRCSERRFYRIEKHGSPLRATSKAQLSVILGYVVIFFGFNFA